MDHKVYATKLEYYGLTPPTTDQITEVSLSSRSIAINSKNIDITGVTATVNYSLDLLYYNRVNSAGEIVSTLVHIGNLHTPSTVMSVTFSPYSMFDSRFNFQTNLKATAQCNTNFSFYNTVREQENTALNYIDIDSDPLDVKTLMNVRNNKAVLDGWYTFITAGVSNSTTGLTSGALYCPTTNTADVQINYNGVYKNIFIPDTAEGVFSRYVTVNKDSTASAKYPKFIRQELFILDNMPAMYNEMMKVFKNSAIIKRLRISDRAITSAAASGKFVAAQMLLQFITGMQSRFINY